MKILALLFLITAFSLSAATDGVVTATKLNVRVKPGTQYAVVAQLKKDEKIQILQHKDGWYKIKAPANTKVWVSSSFIENGAIKKSVHLRAGPSVAFSSFRLAEAGEPVKIIDKSRKEWIRIAPPKDLTAWTSAKYIYLTPENAAKLIGKKKKVKSEKISEETKKLEKSTGSASSKISLPFTEGKGKHVSVDGYLVSLDKDAIYVSHAVASRINGEYFPLCYLHSNTYNLKRWEGKRVNVTGLQRWVKNWQRPVVEVEKITSAW